MTAPLALEMVLRKNLIDLKRTDTWNEMTFATLFSFMVFCISFIKRRKKKKKEIVTKRVFSWERFEVILIIQQS